MKTISGKLKQISGDRARQMIEYIGRLFLSTWKIKKDRSMPGRKIGTSLIIPRSLSVL